MSVSQDYSDPINLYCHESSTDLASAEPDIVQFSNFPVEDESYIESLFDSELDQLVSGFLQFQEILNARQDAISWMLKVRDYYRFRPETAYLSVNYFDRFLSFHTLPKGKGWLLSLTAVACLSIAAKMEETRVPLLLDLQVLEPRFLFKPSTVQRMELLVMARLKWRLHIITPFYFLPNFIAKISCISTNCYNPSNVFSRSSDLIISFCRVISLLDYSPSAIAAATVLWATNQTIDAQIFGCFHERVSKDMVKKCYNLIKKNMSELSQNNVKNGLPASCRAKRYCNKELNSSHTSSSNECVEIARQL